MTNEIRRQSSSAYTYRREITTIEEFKNYLQELQSNASTSVEAALKAQLLVIQYVESPTLSDSSFDLLFTCLRKSIRSASSPVERESLREKAQLIIHNYIFFLDAKLKFMEDENNKVAKELLKDASMQIISMAEEYGKGGIRVNKAALSGQIVDSFSRNFFQKFWDFFFNSSRIADKRSELNKTLDLLFDKLKRHRKLIGESTIIPELIHRWRKTVVNYKNRHLLNYFSNTENTIGFLLADWSICGILWLLLYFISKSAGYPIFGNRLNVLIGIAIVLLNPLCFYLYVKLKCYLLDRKYRRLAESYYPSDDDL